MNESRNQPNRDSGVPPGRSREPGISQGYVTPVAITQQEPPGLLMEYWLAVRSRSKLVLSAALAGTLLAVIVTICQTPVYRTHASVKLPDSGPDAYATHVKMLQSESVTARALARLRFATTQYASDPVDTLTRWRNRLGFRLPSLEEAINQAAASFEARAAGSTAIADLYCDSSDRRVAADYVNFVAAEYVNRLNSGGSQAASETAADPIEEARRALAQSEAALERAENAPSGAAETGDRLRKMNQEAEQAHAERESKSATYESARSASTSTLAVLIGDQQLESLLDQLDAARTKLATLRKTMTDLHPAVVDALATVDKLQRAIDNRRSDLLLRLRLDYEDANRKDNELRGQIAAAESALRDTSHTPPVALLKQDVETNRQNYEQRLEQAKQKRPANAAQEAGVVDLATPPLIPYKPSPLRNVAYGTFAGLLLGLVGAVLWARLDSNIQAPGEAAQYTGAGELGLIPEVNLRGKPPEFKVELAAWQDRLSPTATAFHATATSVLFAFGSEPDGVGAVVVLTSVGASDGKTSTATNLAVAISEARKRVLLIDADTIRPRLRGIFELPSDSGLAELLAGTEPLDEKTLADATQASRFSGLDVLTSGAGGEQAAELLHSPRLPELLALARAKYDFVLIDSPPMLQIPHARIFGRLSDGVILVARAGRTPRASLQAAAAKLREDGTPILGTVLNCWNPRGVGGYGYEAYAQSYKRYGGSRSL